MILYRYLFIVFHLRFIILIICVHDLILLLDFLQVLWVLFTSRLDRCFWIILVIDWNRPHNKIVRCCLSLESLIPMDRLIDCVYIEKLHVALVIFN